MAGLGGCYYIISSYEALDSTVAAWIALVCLIIFTFSFTAGLAPVPWVLVGELLPGRVLHTPLLGMTLIIIYPFIAYEIFFTFT